MIQQGFTLIEVMIALALMALLSIISWQALDLVERSNRRLNASANDTLALMRIMGQLESDIAHHATAAILPQAGVPPATDTPDTEQAPVTGKPASPASTLLPPGIHWSAPVLTVLRSAGNGAWQQVVWGQIDDSLHRAVGPASTTLPLPQAAASEMVLDQVQSFSVRAWIPGHGWAAPDSTVSQQAATGLELAIVRRHKDVAETYRKVVLLP
ncbi:prepilin-type N-terminal cleavage/methylation domain-containing protein [Pusillimonas sp. MFBS29]|uniref:PulJ/GspJ family protein n=1 Tax=Pusillimonas sp. MFBS29 TaxID=2886690 RepID=UPI001D10A218|nr:prepilin-type N-terminal cleavage/methylation domain-containing protein [Pusillimonas sp. MFBS29]MCC2595586.1 prepilin-type N-terminal cleavage/methylation domain-containing protein [Pusillimonas sp. MFBS29]